MYFVIEFYKSEDGGFIQIHRYEQDQRDEALEKAQQLYLNETLYSIIYGEEKKIEQKFSII